MDLPRGKLNGLDLFSGIGGIGLALGEWVRTVAYCEQDRYAQGVLLSRMQSGDIDRAPIWDDVKTLKGDMLPKIDIIFGGFPCQDISVAGAGKGLAGERSGLFFEISRLVNEIRPSFVFLENVPAITIRGLRDVAGELSKIGYDCRWTTLSAASVGANHRRERWFLLAHPNRNFDQPKERGSDGIPQGMESIIRKEHSSTRELSGTSVGERREALCGYVEADNVAYTDSLRELPKQETGKFSINRLSDSGKALANSLCEGLERHWIEREVTKQERAAFGQHSDGSNPFKRDWWAVEPNVGRVANGVQSRVDRIKCLGNSVVPLQVETAFKKLIGLTPAHSAEREKR